jgi:IS30 family transposase
LAKRNKGKLQWITKRVLSQKTDLAKIDEYELEDALNKINQAPRKCLYWKTPIELFQKEVLHLI